MTDYPDDIYEFSMPHQWAEHLYDEWLEAVEDEATTSSFDDWLQDKSEADYERRYTP